MKWLKISLFVLAIAAVVAGIVRALTPKPIAVETAEVTRGPMRVTIDEDGRTRVQDRYVILSPLTGNLGRIELEPGAAVDETTVLARIEPILPPLLDARAQHELTARVEAASASLRSATATIARAESRATFAARQAERLRALTNAGNASAQDLETAELEATAAAKDRDSARFSARVAKHEVEMAKAALERTSSSSTEQFEIRSPIVGTVLRIVRESEGVVTAGTPLMEVADPRAIEIVVDVLTSSAVEISPGDPVVIERWGGPSSLAGHVRLVEPSAFTKVSSLGVEEQRVNVVIALDEPYEKWKSLGDGYAVEAAIVVWEAPEIVQVPTNALSRGAEGWSVFVIEDDIARARAIEVGHSGSRTVEVTSGVSPGDVLVAHPTDRVRDGVAVAPL